MAKQRTKWIWNVVGRRGTYIRVGWIYNKNRGVPDDKIRVQIHSATCHLDFQMRIDEASSLMAGINKVFYIQATAGRIVLQETKENK